MLQKSAMLVRLSISKWNAQKEDRKVSAEVDKAHNAIKGGSYKKALIDKAALDPITRHESRVREYHHSVTLPWGDDLYRLLPAKLYFDYTTKMREFKSMNEQLVAEFEQKYPQLVLNERQRLGTMYDPADYPEVSKIRERFGITTNFSSIQSADDFRVEIGADQVKILRQEIEKEIMQKQLDSMGTCWSRLNDVVSKLYLKMCEDKPLFKDSIMSNVMEVTDILPALNITEDKTLDQICSQVAEVLADHSCFRLRKNPTTRARLKTSLEPLLDVIRSHSTTAH